MLSFLMTLSELVKKLRNLEVKISKDPEGRDYFYITSDALEITVYSKDKALTDVLLFLLQLYESRRRSSV
jgi:hypothetical protein